MNWFLLWIAHAQGVVEINPNLPGTAPNNTPVGIVANFYQFALLIGGLLAFAAIIYSGVKYTLSAGNPSGKSDAKEGITQALLGLLLLLGVYVILYVINPDLTILRLPTLEQPTVSPETIGGVPVEPGTATEADARNQLANAGIGVNAQPPQTTLRGIRQETINELIALKAACGCPMTVSGGTEHGDPTGFSHRNGYKVDLAFTPQLTNYIESHFTPAGNRGGDFAPLFRKPGTNIYYAKELFAFNPSNNHWDVLVKP